MSADEILALAQYVTNTIRRITAQTDLAPELRADMLAMLQAAEESGLLSGAALAATEPYRDLIKMIVAHGRANEIAPQPDFWQALLARARRLNHDATTTPNA